MAMIKVPSTEPSLTAIQAALGLSGVTFYEVLMRPDKFGFGNIVNKYAKDKPVTRAVPGRITDELKRAGRASEGIYWGLKVGANDWSKIHSSTWEYVDRPEGDFNESPYRPWDYYSFAGTEGYDPEAKPTLMGSCSQLENGECYYQSSYPFEVLLEWNDVDNIPGVDVFRCVNDTTTDLRNWYLCIAIDGYARAMINLDAGEAVRPIYYSGTKCERFSCPQLPTTLQQTGTHSVSFFLANLDNAANTAASALKTAWTDVTGKSYGSYAISVPEIVGYTIDFILGHYGKWSAGSMSQFGSNIKVGFVCDEAPTEATTYIVDFSMGTTGGSKSKEFTLAAGSSLNQILTFEPTLVPSVGTTYTCEARLSAMLGNNKVFITSYTQNITWAGTSSN